MKPDYNTNEKPVVQPAPSQTPFKQKDENLSPLTSPPASKSAFGEDVLPKNNVTDSSSARLQKAIKTPGKASMAASSVKLS